MTPVTLAGTTFNYAVEGTGVPVVHMLGGEPAVLIRNRDHSERTGVPEIGQYLRNRFQYVCYNNYRPGGAFGATKADSSADVDRIADNCYLLMQHLNIRQAHFFAHSTISYAALKLALNHPDLVRSISFIEFRISEPMLLKPKVQAALAQSYQRRMSDPKFQAQMEMMRQMMDMAKSGVTPDGQAVDPEIAAEFSKISPVFQEAYAPGADTSDPNSTLLRVQTSAMLSTPYEEVAAKVKQPIFAAIWTESQDWARQSAQLLKDWLPQTEIYTVPKKSHWFSGENDEGLANGLAEFYSRNP